MSFIQTPQIYRINNLVIIMEAFVYEWLNLTNNKKYIGYHKGSEDDGYICSSSSSIFWDDFKNPNTKWQRNILAKGTADACLVIEQKILKEIDLKSDEFYNNARGAEVIFTDEVREKIRQHHLGGSSGMKGKKHSEETKKKIKEAHIKIEHNEEWNNKVSIALKGKKKSQEHIQNMISAMTGSTKNFTKKECEHCNNYFNPVTHSRWHGDKCKQNKNNMIEHHIIKQSTCTHCNKNGNIMAMARWHFDNCKLKKY